MDFHCVISDSHRSLYDNFFKPTIPSSFNLVTVSSDIDQSSDNGDYLSETYLETMRFKVSYVLDLLQKQDDSIFVVSDIDIIFGKDAEQIESDILKVFEGGCYMAPQKEWRDTDNCYNFGFYAVRNNKEAKAFWELIYQNMMERKCFHDQQIVDYLISRKELDLQGFTGLNPDKYVSNTILRGGFPNPDLSKINKESTLLYHANLTDSVRLKTAYLKHVKKILYSNEN